MKIGGFVLGAAFGLVGGVAGCVKANRKFGYPVNWWVIKRNALNDLVRKVLGSGYSVERYTDWSRPYGEYTRHAYNTDEWSKAREGLKNYAEKQKEEKGETVYSVMDILGADGIFDEGRTITAKLSAQCSEFRRGIFGDGGEYTTDEYDIRGETFYVYYLRGGDEDAGYVAAVEKRPVTVNYCGTFVTRIKLDIPGNAAELDDETWGFTEDEFGRTEMTFEEYLDSKLK